MKLFNNASRRRPCVHHAIQGLCSAPLLDANSAFAWDGIPVRGLHELAPDTDTTTWTSLSMQECCCLTLLTEPVDTCSFSLPSEEFAC